MVSSKLQERLIAFEQIAQKKTNGDDKPPSNNVKTTFTAPASPKTAVSPSASAAVGFRRGMPAALTNKARNQISFSNLGNTSVASLQMSPTPSSPTKTGSKFYQVNKAGGSLPVASIQTIDLNDDESLERSYSFHASEEDDQPNAKTSAAKAKKSDDDSFRVEDLVSVGPTYTASSSVSAFEEQLRVARERENKRLQAEKGISTISVKDRQNALFGRSMPNVNLAKNSFEEKFGKNDTKDRLHMSERNFLISPVARGRNKSNITSVSGSRNLTKAPIIVEDEPLEIPANKDADEDNIEKTGTEEQEEEEELIANPPCLLNQDLSMGESYTGDSSFVSFDEQLKIARKRELERRKNETLVSVGGLSLKDRMKMFGK